MLTPLPVSAVLKLPLSVAIVSVALSAAASVGLKTITQVADSPALSALEPPATEKSIAFAPLKLILATLSEAPALLLKVTVLAALALAGDALPIAMSGNASADGVSTGEERTLLPLIATDAGVEGKSLLVTLSVPASAAADLGANCTPRVFEAPTASVNGSDGKAALTAKSVVSESAMALMLRVSLPVLVMTTLVGAEVVPLGWVAKDTVVGCTDKTGKMPVPESATLGTEGEPAAEVNDKVAPSAPAVFGVKVTVNAWVLPAPLVMEIGLPALGVGETVKSVGFWPMKERPFTLIETLPLLVMVTVCEAEVAPLRTLPPEAATSVKLVGEIDAEACAPKPASTSDGLPPSLVNMSSAVSGRAGEAPGLNASVTLLDAPAVSVIGAPPVGTVEVIEKSLASVPLIERPLKVSVAAPLFFSTAVKIVPLVDPTEVGGKLLAPEYAALATG